MVRKLDGIAYDFPRRYEDIVQQIERAFKTVQAQLDAVQHWIGTIVHGKA